MFSNYCMYLVHITETSSVNFFSNCVSFFGWLRKLPLTSVTLFLHEFPGPVQPETRELLQYVLYMQFKCTVKCDSCTESN